MTMPTGKGVDVKVAVGVFDGVGDAPVVGVKVRVGVAVGTDAEFKFLGVPQIGLLLASKPFRVRLSFVCQLLSLSALRELMRSIVQNVGDAVPAGHAPPFPFAVSMTFDAASRNVNGSFEFSIAFVKNWSADISLTVKSSVLRSSRKYPFAGIVPVSVMFGTSSDALSVHPVKSIAALVLL